MDPECYIFGGVSKDESKHITPLAIHFTSLKYLVNIRLFVSATCQGQCLNGGQCTSSGTCICPTGYQGARCETRKHAEIVLFLLKVVSLLWGLFVLKPDVNMKILYSSVVIAVVISLFRYCTCLLDWSTGHWRSIGKPHPSHQSCLNKLLLW